jgi:hypothetical protein
MIFDSRYFDWILRHILKSRFFFISSRSMRLWLQILKKVLLWPLKRFLKIQYRFKNRLNILNLDRLKSCQKGFRKKVRGPYTFAHSTKRWTTRKFVQNFVNNSFGSNFFHFFNGFEIRPTSAFLITIWKKLL